MMQGLAGRSLLGPGYCCLHSCGCSLVSLAAGGAMRRAGPTCFSPSSDSSSSSSCSHANQAFWWAPGRHTLAGCRMQERQAQHAFGACWAHLVVLVILLIIVAIVVLHLRVAAGSGGYMHTQQQQQKQQQ